MWSCWQELKAIVSLPDALQPWRVCCQYNGELSRSLRGARWGLCCTYGPVNQLNDKCSRWWKWWMVNAVLRRVTETHNTFIHRHLKRKSILLGSKWSCIFLSFTKRRIENVINDVCWNEILTALLIHSRLLIFFYRNTKSTSSLLRHGQTAASDTTAQWKYWLWTAIWWDLFGSQILSSETPRMQIPTGLQCQTSSSEYGMMGRYFTP